MTRQDIIRGLLAEYQAERLRAERDSDRREEEAEARDPALARLREQSASLVLDCVKRMSDPELAAQAARDMREKGTALARERDARLRALGYPDGWLAPRWKCPVCRDTGYVGDVPQTFCDCFRRRLAQKLYEDGSLSGGERQSFETFDESVFPEENGQRRQALAARDHCLAYADAYPDVERHSLVLTGGGGLGKTFLLNCIYERAVSRGIAAVRVSAYRLNEIMRDCHMQQDDGAFDDLMNAPLLLIDDLGTEPVLRNVTIEYLFQLVNERMAAGRGTVTATNLAPRQLLERYGERVASRLLDRRRCAAIALTGRDVRFL